MRYSGPPPSSPPPPGWRPPVVVRQAPPPTALPAQDHASLDAAERAARRVSWLVAGAATLVAVFVICALAGRLLS